MKERKITDIMFAVGIIVIIAGVLGGIIAGVTGGNGFNYFPAVVVWLVSVISGTGLITISGSLHEAKSKEENDIELLQDILNKVKNDKGESQD